MLWAQKSAIRKGHDNMSENATPQESQHAPSLEAVRLLWEGTRKALERGLDHADLTALCDIISRLADHRLARMEAGLESDRDAEQLRRCRDESRQMFQWATKPVPEPDWNAVNERLKAEGLAPLELEGCKE